MPSESDSDPKVNSSSSFSAWWTKCRPFSGSLSRSDRTQPFVDKESSRKPAEGFRTLIKRASRAHIQSTPKSTLSEESPDYHKNAELQKPIRAAPEMSNPEQPLAQNATPSAETTTDPWEPSRKEYALSLTPLIKDDTEPFWDLDARKGEYWYEKLGRSESVMKDPAANITMEEKAAKIVYEIREFERSSPEGPFRNLPGEEVPAEDSLDMGGRFLTNKERVQCESKVFDIAKEMPKGTLLHLHFNAQLDAMKVIEMAFSDDESESKPTGHTLFISSKIRIQCLDDFFKTEIQFLVNPPNRKEGSVFEHDYLGFDETNKPRKWMKWEDFRNTYERPAPDSPAAKFERPRKNVKEWVLSKMVSSPEMVHRPEATVNDVWARFNQSTRAFKGLVSDEKAFVKYVGLMIDSLIDDKIMYAELRPMWMNGGKAYAKFNKDGTFAGHLSIQEQIKIIVDAVKVKQDEQKEIFGEDHFPFDLKIIYCTPRSISNDLMQMEINNCIKLKKDNPDIICGFDLVGAEDRKNPIAYYGKQLEKMKENCDIEFMFHAGESLIDMGGTNDPRNSNLYSAVQLGAKRIGHGFALTKHSHKLLEKIKTEKGCLELCPISNELLHLCRNVKEHPFPQFLLAGVHCTLNSDNPSLFTNSLSFEFYQVMVGWACMSLYGWKQLALWSIEHSCLSVGQKKDAFMVFRQQWARFCETIVEKYEENVFEHKLRPGIKTKFTLPDALPVEVLPVKVLPVKEGDQKQS